MSTVNTSFVSCGRLKRDIVLWFGISILTILCHDRLLNTASEYTKDLSGVLAVSLRSPIDAVPDDRRPKANDDQMSTNEEIPVNINILANDTQEGDRDDDDDESAIDPTSIDLNPDTEVDDKIVINPSGTFSVNNDGILTYTPLLNYFGNSRISYNVRNFRGEKSNKANITASVANTNDPPVITGQNPDPLVTNEDVPLTIGFSHLAVTDPDNSYPTGFSLSVAAGTNYTVNNNVITPAANYSGPLSVPVTVNDGTASSNQYVLNVTVNTVNDVPIITAQNPNPINATEEQAFTIDVANLSITDPDDTYPGDFTISIGTGANFTASGNSVTPAANFSGPLTVPVTVSDGAASSAVFNVAVTVANVNDAPVITGQAPLTTGEDQAIAIAFSHLTVQDPDDPYPTGFAMTLQDGDNYSISGTTVTPDADFSGALSVPVTVQDAGGLVSNPFTLAITVTNSNDAPIITGQSTLTVDEDNSITVTLAHLTVTDNDNAYPTDFTLALGAGTNYTLSGTTVIPSPNFFGSLMVPVTVNDGTSPSNTFQLSITVNPVNDTPVITGQASLNTNENTAITLVPQNFTVADPDNTYPTGFTLNVAAGANYSVSGTTVTPATGFNGPLSVGISVFDGNATSATFQATITVNAVNNPPVITGNNPLTVAEDNPLTIQLANLIVDDSDSAYPGGFTLTVMPGANYSVSGTTITPALNFNGVISVGVYVNDGSANSNVYSLPVTVTPVNDAPQITSQQPITIAEDQPVLIDFSKLVVSDPDNAYPTGFSLTLFSGLNYTLSGATVTPALNYRGTLSVPVQVSDGQLGSNIFQLQITVSDVNDTPVITGQTPVTTAEDTPIAIGFTNLFVLDPDNSYPTGFTMAIAAGANYTVSGYTITPALNFNGTLNIPVTVNDGVSTSAPFNFQIQVGDSNDPPVITGQLSLSTNEETPITITLPNLTVTDPDNPYPTGFSLEISAGNNYTFQGASITPAPNYVGTLTVPVRVSDGVNFSPTFNLSIQVNQVNDAPSFDAIANQSILENGKPSVISITGVSKGPGENEQQLTFSATSSNISVIPNPTISYGGATTAQLTYTLAPNASGLVTITVTATDNGPAGSPHQNSYSSTFQINVADVNNAPTLDQISNMTLNEDATLQTVNLTGITAGAGENQTLSVEVTTDKPALFETLAVTYTSPQNTGTLQFKPSANSYGVATLNVKVTDNGSNAAPSINSVTRTFTVNVQAVNDMPVFTTSPVTVAAVNEPYEYVIQFSDVETPNLALVAANKPAWATLTSLGVGRFRLSGNPPASSSGQTSVILQVNDSGVTATQQFNLVVNNRPVVTGVKINLMEDATFTFAEANFSQSYSDADQHSLKAVVVVQLPPNGKLTLSNTDVKANDTIEVAAISSLQYRPNPDYDQPDVFFWKGFDGYHLSAAQASVDIAISPVNDAPVITVAQDTLNFEVNGEPKLVSQIFDITDPDSDSLSRAEIRFTQNHDLQFDQLLLQTIGNIRGVYDPQSGSILLTGLAPIADYKQVMASIQYNYLNTLDPILKMKKLTYTASDGIATSEPKDRLIDLKYTFIDLEIPSGFTPNGDSANDYWVITRPGGLDQLQGASIRVMNRRGVVVYEARGFDRPWDGTLNGEALPSDSYFFTIDLNLRSKKTYKGVVTILR